jgi:hypothetical protein
MRSSLSLVLATEPMDKSGANYAGLANINLLLILAGFATMIDICQVKYLNNIIALVKAKSALSSGITILLKP